MESPLLDETSIHNSLIGTGSEQHPTVTVSLVLSITVPLKLMFMGPTFVLTDETRPMIEGIFSSRSHTEYVVLGYSSVKCS